MNQKFQDFVSYIGTKPQFNSNELRGKLREVAESFKQGEKMVEKHKSVTEIKKYDILHYPIFGYAHYVLVHKVTEDKIYGFSLTSQEKCFCIHKIEKDRFFNDSFVTSTYVCELLENVKDKFIRVYESKAEANEIFRKAKLWYKENLNL